MKNGSHRCNINRPRNRHGHKYTKYKMYNNNKVIIKLTPKQQLKLNS